MKSLPLCLTLVLLAGSVLRADPPAPVASPVASTPSAQASDPLAEALPILETKYPDFKALQCKEGDHLGDLIVRSNGRISLKTPGTTLAAAPVPIVTALLPDNILYWRLASFAPEKNWADLTTQLAQAAPTAAGVILDLRTNAAPDDYSGAAQVLSLFVPADTTLAAFLSSDSVQNSGGDGAPLGLHSVFHSPIVVLTNSRTTGAAEVLAACLKADGAVVVGRATAGKMGMFEEQKLSSGQVLRYYVGPVVPPDANSRPISVAWGQPVVPDLGLAVNDQVEKGALIYIARHRILEVIQESPERHRMSEASLVHGDDPEWDAYVASLEKKSDDNYMSLPPIRDLVLINALDSLKAIQLSQRPPAAEPKSEATPQTASSIQ